MTDVSDPRTLLSRHGLMAKKSWGQNFLVASHVYDAIVRAAVKADDEPVVEIGAGLGTLTARLADAAPRGRVFAVERDPDMLRVLQAELGARPNVEILAANALALDYAALAARAGRPLALAGNLPYQIASPLLVAMLEARRSLVRAVVMLQKEMADRLLARPGTRESGSLGVLLATYADIRRVVRAPSSCFHPRPRVDSTVVVLEPLPGGAPRVAIADERRYAQVVHAAFGHRRKTLHNALRGAFPHGDAGLARAGIDPQRRGETLTIDELAALANALGETS